MTDYHGWSRSDKTHAIHVGILPGRKKPSLYMVVKDGKGARCYPLAYFKSEEAAIEAINMFDELIEVGGTSGG